MAPRNLVNLKAVGKGYAGRAVLEEVTLGVAAGERIGVVGRNGGGKSTLLRLIGGDEVPDTGAVTRERGLRTAVVAQRDELDPGAAIEAIVARGRPEHEWRGHPVLAALLGGVPLDKTAGRLSGGERRRVALAVALLEDPELLLLDEPTNHLDVEAVDWLAHHLAGRRSALVVVTHDRWFLDAVVQQTWEVADGAVHQYEGGYAAYVLAKAERERQAASSEGRRQQLLRKELAWLRRGPPARTSKPKFRIEAANALIADVPDVRDKVELLRFSGARLGDRVLDAEAISVDLGGRRVLHDLTWRLGPGDRVAVVGPNGTGKSTLLRALAGEQALAAGRVDRGSTVRPAFLTQEAAELPPDLRVLDAVEAVARRTTLADGRELTAGGLLERLGFAPDRQRTRVDDLSGGERRRLQLTRLLMGEPNVLLLDEPTNDLDTEVLAALEDLLDGWAGTLVVVSHDRYFIERVCDDVFGLTPTGGLRHLPGGVEQELADRRAAADAAAPRASARGAGAGALRRAAQKEAARLERAVERLGEREAALQDAMAEAATDHARLRALAADLAALRAERDEVEAAWLEAAELLEA